MFKKNHTSQGREWMIPDLLQKWHRERLTTVRAIDCTIITYMDKCDITDDEFDPWLYDEACGEGMAQKAINDLRKEERMMGISYDGPLAVLEISRTKNDDKIAEIFHNAFKGKQDYINNVIINKDGKLTIHLCIADLIDRDDIFDTLTETLKLVEKLI